MTNQSWDFFRFRLRTQLWLMTPWEGLPNHSKATMNLCRHTRYLRISHCRTVRREFSKSYRYIPCVSLQISASSSCFFCFPWNDQLPQVCNELLCHGVYCTGRARSWISTWCTCLLVCFWPEATMYGYNGIYGDVWYAYIHLVIRHVLIPCPVAAESPLVLKFARLFVSNYSPQPGRWSTPNMAQFAHLIKE